jgi:hypothetical protein
MYHGRAQPHSPTVISALGAFWPALQVLSGRVDEAINSFSAYEDIWNKYFAIPDMYDFHAKAPFAVYGRDYPLRPEMIESAYHLYLATKDVKYVEFGERVLDMLETRCRVECGYASLADVETDRLDDRMDSYFLAETLKYLYLLFDEAVPDPKDRDSMFCHGSVLSGHQPLSRDSGIYQSSHESALSSINIAQNLTIDDSELNLELQVPSANPSIILSNTADLSHPHPLSSSATTILTSSESMIVENIPLNEETRKQAGELQVQVHLKQSCLPPQSTIFTTEGHILILHPSLRTPASSTRKTSSWRPSASSRRSFLYDMCPVHVV